MTRLPFRLLSLIVIGLLLAVVGCRRHAAPAKPADVDYYTCSMHPSVHSEDPNGHCPICSMPLVPVKKTITALEPEHRHNHGGASHDTAHPENVGRSGEPPADAASQDKPREFSIPLDRLQLIGVTYATVEKSPLSRTIRAVGTVALDRLRHWDYVSRVEGYVQKLGVASRGDPVKRDQPLLSLYSPDLLSTQREFIEALRLRDQARASGSAENIAGADRLISAARRRLTLWNLGEAQLDNLEKNRESTDTLTLTSPFDGVVLDLATNQGSRVMPGDHLVDVADLSVVWVWAELYQEELPLVRPSQPVTLTAAGYPGEKWQGSVALVDPFLDQAKRTGRVRIDVSNPAMTLRPEMYVNVEFLLTIGESLNVPVSSVLPTGERNVVFVDKDGGKFEPRLVTLGQKYGDRYVVLEGLHEGERVVASANFLIDAEAKTQGALKSW
jgi:RND family efflux transporter MFP subunit